MVSKMRPSKQDELMKKALTELRKMRAKLKELEQAKHEPIAVIGLGCRFPGAESPEAFWQLLAEKKDAITETPEGRWDLDAYYDPDSTTPGKICTRFGGYLDRLDEFDPLFFKISPREALSLDPQQRLLLEVSWEALEDAAIAPDSLLGSQTGVFIGMITNEYSENVFRRDPAELDIYADTGTARSVATGRLSYLLGLHGPSLAVDTACSSSLVALHLAVGSLRQGESDLALVGGVHLLLSPEMTCALSQGQMLAPDGRCKTFDAAADGYVRGEGCGMVVLKRLSDALADGDRIQGLILGSAVNHDGRTSGLTVPNGPAQQAVIRQALKNSRVKPGDVSYVEAHGTGTSLGDPIEVGALGAVFEEREQPLFIGTVKTNIGHLEGAAGIAGLIKVILSFQNGEIPAHLHFHNPSPHIPWAELPVKVPTERTSWPTRRLREGKRRIAGLSGFGSSGTNVHLVLAERPSPLTPLPIMGEGKGVRGEKGAEVIHNKAIPRPLNLLTLSAKTEAALQELAETYLDYFNTRNGGARCHNQPLSLADICFTTHTGRSHFESRLAVMGKSISEIQKKLDAFVAGKAVKKIRGLEKGQATNSKPKIAFLFTGQGAQSVGMARQLYETQATFRATLDRCDAILRELQAEKQGIEKPLLEVLYPDAQAANDSDLINETTYAQPALFAIEVALAELWKSWGIRPHIVMGHSMGEYVAACVAGVFSLEDGLKLIAARGRLMQQASSPRQRGAASNTEAATAAVFANAERVAEVIAPYTKTVSLAGINGPKETLIAGAAADVKAILAKLPQKDLDGKLLRVPHASHSPLMEPILDEFEQVAREITYHAPHTRLISNVTGDLIDQVDAAYWRQHMRMPVQLAAGVKQLEAAGCHIMLEIGPQPVLLWLGRQNWAGARDVSWLASLWSIRQDWQQILETLSQLYVRGVKINWAAFHRDEANSRRKVALPTYPFQRKRYWIERPSQLTTSSRSSVSQHQTSTSNPDEWLYELKWRKSPLEIKPPADSPLPLGEGLGVERAGMPVRANRWLIFADQRGTADRLRDLLLARGERCTFVTIGEANKLDLSQDPPHQLVINPTDPTAWRELCANILTNHPRQAILYLWGLDAEVEEVEVSLERAKQLTSGYLLSLVQALLDTQKIYSPTDAQLPKLWLVSQGTQAVSPTSSVDAPFQGILWGLGRVIAVELPEIWGGLVDLDPEQNRHLETLDLLVDVVLSASDSPLPLLGRPKANKVEGLGVRAAQEKQVAIRQGERYVPRLVPAQEQIANQPIQLRSDGSYLLVGGLDHQASIVTRWMIKEGVKSLVLVEGSTPPAEIVQSIEELAQQKGTQLTITQIDLTQYDQMAEVLANLVKCDAPPLRGVIQMASHYDVQHLLQQNQADLAKFLVPKVDVSWNLHRLTAEKPLDFFIIFSSGSGLLGGVGLAGYAAGNSFMDALAHYRHQKGLPIVSINWGVWANVDGVGHFDDHILRSRAAQGVGVIEPREVIDLLARTIARAPVQLAILPMDWHKYVQVVLGYKPPLLTELLEMTSPQPSQAAAKQAEEGEAKQLFPLVSQATAAERRQLIQSFVQQQIVTTLYLEQEELQPGRNLLEFGLDSLGVMNILNACREALQFMLFPREFYNRPFLDKFAHYLAEEFEQVHGIAPKASQESQKEESVLEEVPHDLYLKVRSSFSPPKRDVKLPSVLFILSTARAGSTLFRIMLAGHPALFSPPELNLLLFESLAEHQDEGHLGEGFQRVLMELHGLDAQDSQALIHDLIGQGTTVEDAYHYLQEAVTSRLLVDKSPFYASYPAVLQRAEQLFDQPKYIHLVRHPIAVIESFVRNRMDKNYGDYQIEPLTLGEQHWYTANRNILTHLESVPAERQLTVNYEDLVRQPTETMEAVCEWLSIPFNEALLKPYQGQRMADGVHAQSIPMGDPNFQRHGKIRPELADAWRQIQLSRPLSRETCQLAAKFGYPSTGPEPHQSPNRPLFKAIEQPAPSTSANERQEELIDVGGLSLCLSSWGEREGIPIVCLHGSLDHSASWEGVANRLASRAYRVLAPDHRGHGRSGHINANQMYHLWDFVSDFDGIVRQLKISPMILVGHSMGSIIAALYAAARPQHVSRLVLVEPIQPLADAPHQRGEGLATQLSLYFDYQATPSILKHPVLPDLNTAAERLRHATPAMSSDMALRMAERLTVVSGQNLVWRWDPRLNANTEIQLGGMGRTAYLNLLSGLKLPITVVYGAQSRSIKPEEKSLLQAALPTVRPITLNGGHNLHIDVPASLAEVIQEAAQEEVKLDGHLVKCNFTDQS